MQRLDLLGGVFVALGDRFGGDLVSRFNRLSHITDNFFYRGAEGAAAATTS